MLNVYLLRHGETTFNADNNKYCGITDAELTKTGIRQAEEIAGALQKISFDAVYSSPLQRAYKTAEIASGEMNVIKDDRLIELNFGKWEGKPKETFIAEDTKLWEQWCQNPGRTRAGATGETAGSLIERVNDFFSELQKTTPQGTVMVVAHNAVNRFFIAGQLGMDLKDYRTIVQENCSVTLIGFDEEGFSLKKLNCRG